MYGTIHGFGVSLSLLLSLTPPWLAWCTGATLCIALDIGLEDGRMTEENSPLYSVT